MGVQFQTADLSDRVLNAARDLKRGVGQLNFDGHVDWIYNPLQYAWEPHRQYIKRYLRSSCQVLFLGMNPGPWGMAQTGVPFGEVSAVRQWLGIDARIGKPAREHPKRPIEGFGCSRSEVSGKRLWGLFRERFASPEAFFKRHFVANYCPLVFMEASARNLTPDKLPAMLKQPLEAICDRHLLKLLKIIQPQWLIGVGAWAESCARRVVEQHDLSEINVGRLLHPSPASPAANRNWASTATDQLKELGLWD
jgi:single-strand selective monofunctional uracil DNA glycosylase